MVILVLAFSTTYCKVVPNVLKCHYCEHISGQEHLGFSASYLELRYDKNKKKHV